MLYEVITRLSNTASLADYWLSPWPGSEAPILLAIASHLIHTGRYNREFVKTVVSGNMASSVVEFDAHFTKSYIFV